MKPCKKPCTARTSTALLDRTADFLDRIDDLIEAQSSIGGAFDLGKMSAGEMLLWYNERTAELAFEAQNLRAEVQLERLLREADKEIEKSGGKGD